MAQLENIEAIEKRLWGSADTLRANSNYASNEYFMPVMGLIFLRHAFSRFLAVKPGIEASLPKRGGVTRPLTKEDFSSKGAIFLREKAQFDHLVSLTDADDRAQAIIDAMEAIEADYETLKGVLPKTEYQELDNDVLGNLLRTFNDPALKKATGDIFGRIYEYFLTKFADQKAHDGGEFFTPVSLVQMIVNFIEPDHGSVIDPACGSGGMFVQSAHFIERMHKNPQDVATFYGAEKNPTTIRLAKMNLAVHGLEGKIQKAISYYEDPHDFLGKADFVMANPPFNVDDVDAEKIKNDPRLPFGLPGVNKKGAVSNGNYLWISYFYSYLSKQGRAGFVMSSQASSAGGQEAEVRRKLVESGHVEGMIAIRSNFFYTRTVPCELWFLNKNKPAGMKDKVLMLDARNIYTKVTRKIYDFSPEQLANLTSIVWLSRGQKNRYLKLVESYLTRTLDDANAVKPPMDAFFASYEKLAEKLEAIDEETSKAYEVLTADIKAFQQTVEAEGKNWKKAARDNAGLLSTAKKLEPLAETSRDLVKQIDQLYKLIEKQARQSEEKGLSKLVKELDEVRKAAVEQLKLVRYIFKQAQWLQERFKAHTLMQAIARANRVAEGKNNGLIVDYCGILKNLRKALATFAGHTGTTGDQPPGEIDPVKPEEELLADLAETIEAVRAFLAAKSFRLEDVLEKTGFERNKAIVNAKEVVNQNDETRKRFEIMCREVFKKFKACLTIKAINDYRASYDAINVIYKSLQEDVDKADISDIMRELHAVIEASIEPDSGAKGATKLYDISKIDFDRLRKEFERSPAKNTTVHSLKEIIERKLFRLLMQNPARTDFQKHYEEIVENYNSEKDRVTIEATFEALLKLVDELGAEETRAMREGLDEESLALFDLLQKPELSKAETARIKKVAVELLKTLKAERLKIENWRDKEGTRDAVKQKIFDFLYDEKTGLPVEEYSEKEIKTLAENIFSHVYRAYPTIPSPIYGGQ